MGRPPRASLTAANSGNPFVDLFFRSGKGDAGLKVCVVGGGAVGGLIGGMLAQSGDRVTLIDQGDHLAAIRQDGLRIIRQDGSEDVITDLDATDSTSSLDTHELVVIAVKGHQIADIAPQLPRLYQSETIVLTVQNGLPWWYFGRHGGPLEGHRLETLDPSGVIAANIPLERIIGGVFYAAAEKSAPGVVRHVEGNRFPVGELNGDKTQRIEGLADRLTAAGFRSRILDDVRAELWLKAWGTLSFNPISALARATMVEISQFPEARVLVRRMMEEAEAIAHELGITFRRTIDERIEGAEKVGAHKTSMLQDIESASPLELTALVGSIIELGTLTGQPTPSIDAVYACAKLLEAVVCRTV